ncbi:MULTISPECIES: class I SAM-dependent methyltransferase [Spirulina sp. CCY15215]|uniref:class I SAM-dependent methyltransferase n=1 Tax=Spirulina sp. CCY15215 TaxID=2767591 RepID=UPI00194F68E5|nr:class I SAM-dependent methyltransferase [Spirulina major]
MITQSNSNFPNSQALLDIICDRIANSPQHRLTFAEYMDLVLYHPKYGYYSVKKAKIGKRGDFVTSPSLSSDFAELLGEQFLQMWEILGKPQEFSLLEMGAGEGDLACDLLNYLQSRHPDYFATLQYNIIEQSPSLILRQKEKLQNFIDNSSKICWRSWLEIEDNSQVGCFFSNELIDAFPVHSVTINEGKLQEVYITLKEGKLTEAIGELSTQKLKEYFRLIDIDILGQDYREGYRSEVNLAALEWIEQVNNKLKSGYLLTIDYGYSAQRYYNPQRYQGTIKCYYQHRHHDDPYANLGYQDITAHVDFTALERQGKNLGLEEVGLTQQGLFLMALGLGDRLSELSTGKFNLIEVLKRREVLHQLIDPAGLGRFNVLIQRKNLNEIQKLQGLETKPLHY